MDRALRLLGGVILAVVMMGMIPGPAPAQDTDDAPVRPTQTGDPPCREPSPCPATDTTKNPEITCYDPHASPSNEDVTLHIYGRHLAKKDEPPAQLAYRNSWRSGSMAKTREEFEVKSACHLVTTLYVRGDRALSEGDSVEFRLQRKQPTLAEYKEGSMGKISDWYYIKLTESKSSEQSLQITPSATAKEESPCDLQDPAATSIGDLSGRHHMNTVRLEGIVVQANAKTGSAKKAFALQGETGTIRVTTSRALPEVDTWYSVTGEVAFNPSSGGEYLKEQDRTACK